MTDNFDLRKYLVENKITTQSRLNEAEDTLENKIKGKKVDPEFDIYSFLVYL